MIDPTRFLNECEQHQADDTCKLHSLISTPANGEDDLTCTGCGLTLSEVEQSIASALSSPPGKAEQECTELIEKMSSQFDSMTHAAPVDRKSVRQVGPYEIQERIGRGSMGTVYRGRHNLLQRDFAVKILDARGQFGSKTLKRFRREIRSLGKVRHPNVVQATDAGQDLDVHYIAMELLDGIDLGRLSSKRTLPIPTACELVRQAALGVHHAHAHGLVHRDVKPSNLMLCHDNGEIVVKVLDLGLARLDVSFDDEDDEDLTPAGIILGTFGYMSPEQLEDPRKTTATTDIYSLGVVLWKLVTGQGLIAEPPDSKMLSQFPEELQVLIQKAVVSDLTTRLASAQVLAEKLEPFADANSLASLLPR